MRFKALKTGHFALSPAETMGIVKGTEYVLPDMYADALKRQGFMDKPIVEKAAEEAAPAGGKKSGSRKAGARAPADETKDENPADETK